MANGDKKDPTGSETPPPPPVKADGAEDALAAAEAELRAAEEAAEEARRKAAELAAKRAALAETTAPPQEDEPPELGVDKQAPPPPPPVPAAMAVEPAADHGMVEIDPNAEGLFGTDEVNEVAGASFVPETPYLKGRRNRWALIALAAALVLIAGGVVYLASDTDATARMKWFLAGTSCVQDPISKGPRLPDIQSGEAPGNANCLQLYVEQERRLKEQLWKEEDFRSRHIYGTTTLTYFPQDARVDVYQTKFVQDGRAWARNEAGAGEMVCDAPFVKTPDDKILSPALKGKDLCERVLTNKTASLEENQFIERLPLKNMPIFETDKCVKPTETAPGSPFWDASAGFCKTGGQDFREGAVVKAYAYNYRILISRDGYEPREFIWTKRDWTRAPGQYIMNWQGADLIPKPETYRENFVAAQCQIFCYQVAKEVPYDKIPEANLELIFKRNGFKDEEDFRRAEGALTRGEFSVWWEAQFNAIKAFEGKIDECAEPQTCADLAAASVATEGEEPPQ